MGLKQGLIGLLGSRVISDVAIRATSKRLRIVAYHGIPDSDAFERHLIEYAERFNPVSGERVAAALTSGSRLPDRAVWLTFDDGHPEVEVLGRPLLERYGLTATMYVCPGVIDTAEPFWWETVREAARLGLVRGATDSSTLPLEGKLKVVPDATRRRFVAELTDRIEERLGRPYERPQLSTDQLLAWASAGQEVGNHSWDHPLLDRCTEIDQKRQARDAHDWLSEVVAPSVPTFAYPNGNWAAATEEVLRTGGYATSLGFDHRLARQDRNPLRLSRLRLDTNATMPRFRGITSGAHPLLLGSREQVAQSVWRTRNPRSLPT
jgi:peptidoglycan/xylan/chitin deacetylase (PgdA/CDA1 family)